MKVLLVGCGGIGVEILNNIQYIKEMTRLDLIDMDIVEFSNLSRQYIFDIQDVGQSKVKACERFIKRLRPDIEVNGHVSDVTTSFFNPVYFQQFDYVINALDNIQARQSVAKNIFISQLLNSKPVLVDAGTSGLSGSVAVYANTSCQQICCRKQAIEQPIPVCTLRNKPTCAKHCVVFAKFLIERIFCGIENELLDFDPITGQISLEQAKSYYFKLQQEELTDLIEIEPLKLKMSTDVQKKLTVQESKQIFINSLVNYPFTSPFTYNKDEENQQLLLNAIATLRASRFNIESVSTFEAAALADRIVPAVGFSNALVSSITIDLIQQHQLKPERVSNQMFLISQKAPYIYADALENKQECEFCCKKFAECANINQYLIDHEQTKIYLNNTQVGGKNEDEEMSDWFNEEKKTTDLAINTLYYATNNNAGFWLWAGSQDRVLQEELIKKDVLEDMESFDVM
ncbi:Ubiquitin-activating_enzyme E1 [Hexamita inflata]|uniref:NEDD8-activating enzyme E1 catalytic subunit n=1 Tax=Hexamita inflata TaxID=28002 RepID=A0AA86U589_9EUKA|nr:Ubiquitin-activating enzyme E1 [Hexamita inflata]